MKNATDNKRSIVQIEYDAEKLEALRFYLVKLGKLPALKLGGKIIVPKMCLVSFILDTNNYHSESQIVSENLWTLDKLCGIICNADDTVKAVHVK